MLPLPHRLRHDLDIRRALGSRQSVADGAVVLKSVRNTTGVVRCAVVVGTKVSKLAVVRNRVRRQYRAILAAHLHELPPAVDLLVLTARPCLTLSYAEKEQRLLALLARARLRVAPRGGTPHPRVSSHPLA